MDRDKLIEAISDIIGVGSLAFMLWLFGNFWFRGSFYVGEPSIPIRTAETIFIIIGLLIGFNRFLGDTKEKVIKQVKKLLLE
jgi:hypothetical protein